MKPISLQQLNKMQLGQIHKLGKLAHFDTSDKDPNSGWRQMLKMVTGKTSTSQKVMNTQDYAKIINHLNRGTVLKKPMTNRGGSTRYKNATSRKLVMLWASIRSQGKLRVKEARLEDWLKSQYQKPNPDWLTESERNQAIAKLNSWEKRLLTPRKK